ncbi:APC family permease [Arthrobacter sp. ISL-5]|uniref:APC family permease n=1 Tax=Arthrobacter sp. ISL-5 TaxID=2819111 RepID=UPI001BE8C664|nr:APC family permease [Arthrobacter sp. ISL-5]MBT2554128.1 APC family permease [Arthrobacter sp. ISL-5]
MSNLELPSSGTTDRPALAESVLSFRKALGLGVAYLAVGPNLIFAPTVFGLAAGSGSSLALLLTVPLIGCLVFAISYFARRFVVTGSLMSYMGDAIGIKSRDLTGISLLLGYVLAIPATAIILLTFVQGLIADLGLGLLTDTTSQLLVCLGLVAVAAAVSAVGVNFSVKFAVALSFIGVPLAALLIAGVIANGGLNINDQIAMNGVDLTGIINGVVLVVVAFAGFEGITALAKETRDPERNVPRLLIVMMAIALGAMFVSLVTLTPVFMSHLDDFNSGKSFVSILCDAAGMQWLALPLDLTMTAAYMASLVAVCNDSSRVVATAGVDGILPRALSKINARTKTPLRALVAVVLVGALVLILAEAALGAGPIDLLVNILPSIGYLWLLPYAAICIALVIYAIRSTNLGGATVGIIGAASIVFVTIWSATHAQGIVAQVSPYVVYGAVFILFFLKMIRDRTLRVGSSPKTKVAA